MPALERPKDPCDSSVSSYGARILYAIGTPSRSGASVNRSKLRQQSGRPGARFRPRESPMWQSHSLPAYFGQNAVLRKLRTSGCGQPCRRNRLRRRLGQVTQRRTALRQRATKRTADCIQPTREDAGLVKLRTQEPPPKKGHHQNPLQNINDINTNPEGRDGGAIKVPSVTLPGFLDVSARPMPYFTHPPWAHQSSSATPRD